MGCNASREDNKVDVEDNIKKDFVVKPISGSPVKSYPYTLVDGKPKVLGSGAYSTVYEGTDQKTNAIVAVKKITKANLQPHDHDALKNEVSLLAECKGHPHILSFLEFYEEKDYYYLVTEVITGGELFERICEKESYTEHEARLLVQVLLQTLAHLHEKQIAHRDLKPENLLLKSLDDDSQVVLADFGFATKCKGKSLNQVCGTPDYVAPEIIMHNLYNFKCDIWSAGVITYILLGGYAPFQARNPDDRDELFNVIKKGKVVFHDHYWKKITPEAKDLISKMLDVDPDHRPNASSLMHHPWITASKAGLEKANLDESKERLKEFNAKGKLKSAVNVVKATNSMRKALTALKTLDSSQKQSLANK
mmetsp:Transcript_6838/g.8275  ORF Transcript_6838/g.8275 Transcript_6838/m.8275 type:complete len:364 (+) Transcript_6838:20-1111(+)